MSKMSELAYDIEQLYIEGLSAKRIALQLNISVESVLVVIDSMGCEDAAETDQYYGA